MASKKLIGRLLLVAIVLLVAALPLVAGASSVTPTASLDPLVQHQLATEGRANVFVKMAADANLDAAEAISEKVARVQFVYDTLTAQAAASQQGLLAALDSQGVRYQSFWINNSVYVYDADAALVAALSARPDVAYVRGDHQVPLHRPVAQTQAADALAAAIEWGVDRVNAPDVWATGNTGQGVVVANVDTGVRLTHQALVGNYRGNNGGGSFTHDYNWWDPNGTLPSPSDQNGHGTHTMGTIAGGDGPGAFANDIGVAPGARWIAAQGCESFFCSDFSLISSAQWIACPTKVDGTSPDCSKAPDLVNNSWGGGSGDPWYQSYVNSWTSAGILPIFSAGNSGPSCNTIGSPGDYRNTIGVGATNINNVLASFSSKGPGAFRQQKPDISAPGENVRSSYNTGDAAYANLSGTSMAAPHVAGTIALMLSENPSATRNQIYRALTTTAVEGLGNPPNPDSCGGIPYTTYPNYIYGYGLIDAAAAVGAVSAQGTK